MWLRTHPNGDTAAFAKLTGIGSVWLAQKAESICCYRCLRSKHITPDFGETAARGGLSVFTAVAGHESESGTLAT
jgi:hypothetical protein